MFKKCLFIALGFVLFSCASLEEPIELISYDGSQIKQFTGQVVEFKAGFHVQNKLFVPVKMNPLIHDIAVPELSTTLHDV
jgi:hypothetical protein